MEYETRTYFAENEYSDVKGFSILAAEGGEYHIAEKWLKEDEDVWLDYWVPESDLMDRVNNGSCEAKAKLTDEQYESVCNKVDWYTEQFEESAPQQTA